MAHVMSVFSQLFLFWGFISGGGSERMKGSWPKNLDCQPFRVERCAQRMLPCCRQNHPQSLVKTCQDYSFLSTFFETANSNHPFAIAETCVCVCVHHATLPCYIQSLFD